MVFRIECKIEADGRWIAEAPEISGVLAYGTTAEEAVDKAKTLALRVLAERSSPANAPAFVAHLLTIPKADEAIETPAARTP